MKRIAFLVAIALMATSICVLAQDVQPSLGRAPMVAQPTAPKIPEQTMALGDRGGPAYGCEFYSYGFYNWPDIDVPGTETYISGLTYGGEFVGDFTSDLTTIWVINYYYNQLFTIDITTGVETYQAPCTPSGSAPYWTGGTFDPVNQIFYACSSSISVTYLYTINCAPGSVNAATSLGQISGGVTPAIIDMGYRVADGYIYGQDIVNDTLVQINPSTVSAVQIGATGLNLNYAQGADFDDQADIYYAAAYNIGGGQYGGGCYTVNLTTGAFTLIGAFDIGYGAGSAEVDAFCIALPAISSDGMISIDKTLYGCADTVAIRVMDSDLAGLGTIVVSIDDTTTGDSESVTLFESSSLPGQFDGTIPTGAGGPNSGNGILELNNGDGIAALYIDANDGSGGINVPNYAYATADCVGPVISNVAVGCPGDTFLGISWTTDEDSDSTVNYGLTTGLGSTTTVASMTTSHSVTLTGLAVNSLYYFEVCSTDEALNSSCDNNGGLYYTANTLYSISTLPFGNVRGVAVDGAGDLWFANYPVQPPTDQALIVHMSSAGSLLTSFYPPSSYVQGLAFQPSNNHLWLATTVPAYIRELTTTGGLVSSFIPWGASPTGVGFEASTVWVADQGGTPPSYPNVIWAYSTAGSLLSTYNYPSSPAAWDPYGFGHYNGFGYAIDRGLAAGPQILELDDTGAIQQTWCSADTSPWGCDAAGGYLWYSGQATDKLFRLALPTVPPTVTPTSTTPLPIPTTGSAGMAIALALFSALLIGQRALRRASR